jgi:hypothetical protein
MISALVGRRQERTAAFLPYFALERNCMRVTGVVGGSDLVAALVTFTGFIATLPCFDYFVVFLGRFDFFVI